MDSLLSPRRRHLVKALGAATLLAGCGAPLSPGARRPLAAMQGPSMGTVWNAKVAGEGAEALAPRAAAAVADALGAVVARMSAFRPDSELAAFNALPAGRALAVSADTIEVFARAREVSAATGGAFDVTVAPAVDAWGFGPAGGHRIPGREELDALAGRIDWRSIVVDGRAGTLAKLEPGVRADLSAIAKGYGVDRAAHALEALGAGDYLVEAGGELRTRGRNAQGKPWRVGIERPDGAPGRPWIVVPLADLAMATSGDYRIFFERHGRRYSHEIDPATREPVQDPLASVSVVAPDCTWADAMATALFVMGVERGFAFAEARGLAALFIERGARGLTDRRTTAFGRLVA